MKFTIDTTEKTIQIHDNEILLLELISMLHGLFGDNLVEWKLKFAKIDTVMKTDGIIVSNNDLVSNPHVKWWNNTGANTTNQHLTFATLDNNNIIIPNSSCTPISSITTTSHTLTI